MAPLGKPSKVSMRLRISAAALLVKVTARMLFGDAPSTWINHATRCTNTRVLPLPARAPPFALDHPRNPVHQPPGLPPAGAGQHQAGPQRRGDGLALIVIEPVE